MTFDFSPLLRDDLPKPAAPWGGFPQFNFVGGNNDERSVPVDALREAADTVLAREGATLGTYFLHSGPLGYLPLREFLVKKLKRYADITCTADNILITSGSLQAIDLINGIFLDRGDTVIVEESNYGGVLSRLNSLGVNMIKIPVDGDGMRDDVLESELKRLADQGIKPKYIYTIPSIHNPTGTILSEARRRRMIALAQSYRVPIFEDECYSDLVWDQTRPPALRALDDSGLVIHVGSFSKCIAPALRVGYIVADWPVLAQILAVKADAGSGALEQMVLAEFCNKHFDDHVAALNKTLEAKLDTLIEALNANFGTAADFQRPKGGIFLWVRLPDSVETTKLAAVAGAAGVAVNPGAEWSLGADADHWIRICFASPTHEELRAGMARLAEICHAEFGTPSISANIARDNM